MYVSASLRHATADLTAGALCAVCRGAAGAAGGPVLNRGDLRQSILTEDSDHERPRDAINAAMNAHHHYRRDRGRRHRSLQPCPGIGA